MNTRFTRAQYIGGLLLLVAVVSVGTFLLWQGSHRPGFKLPVGEETPIATTTTYLSSSTAVVTTPDGLSYTIERIPVTENLAASAQAPDYRVAISCPGSMSADQCGAIKARNDSAITKLASTPTDFSAWVELGTEYKLVGDYVRARTAWEYVVRLYPTHPVAYANLGDLYSNFIHDYARAETNYLKAITYKADDPNPYRALFTIYSSTSYKPSNTAAEDILKKGVAANPKSVDLQVLLARHYKALGRTSEAASMYEAAAKNAESQSQAELAASIRAEAK